VVSGRFLRKTARMQTNMTLGPVRPGDMVELAAVLGDGTHTYTLTAQSSGSVLRISIDALREVFNQYAPLRMRLLEELAREVSRAYIASCLSRGTHARRKAQPAAKS
jgi:CRP-like cAMP-binding protein